MTTRKAKLSCCSSVIKVKLNIWRDQAAGVCRHILTVEDVKLKLFTFKWSHTVCHSHLKKHQGQAAQLKLMITSLHFKGSAGLCCPSWEQ